MVLTRLAACLLLAAAATLGAVGCGVSAGRAATVDAAAADLPIGGAADGVGTSDLGADASSTPADTAPPADSATPDLDATGTAGDVTEWMDASADAQADSGGAGGDSAGDVADAAIDAGPQVCFHGGPPAADAWVADVPAPTAVCSEVAPPEWFDGQAVPAPTLNLQVGWRDKAGTWHPYNNGDWVPLLTANQGGFHVELVPVVMLPGQTAAVQGLQLQSFTLFGCDQIGNAATAMSTFVQTAGPEGEYTLDPAKQVFTIFGTGIGNIDKYCGIWIHVYWRVRVKGTNQWGEAVRLLRTYNSLPETKS